MTFKVNPPERYWSLHGVVVPAAKRRCVAARAVASTVDHADIRGLVTALLSSVCEPVCTPESHLAWLAAA